jgi:preprotein translocase subunit SecD
VDGRVIQEPVIREPILGGSGQLIGFGVDEGKALAERLSSGAAKIEIETAQN